MLGSDILALYAGQCHTCFICWAVPYLLYMLGSVTLALYARQFHTSFIRWETEGHFLSKDFHFHGTPAQVFLIFQH